MTKREAIEYFGTAAAVGRALGIGRAAVGAWDEIPIDRQCQLEIVTGGAIKADRDKLFPQASESKEAA